MVSVVPPVRQGKPHSYDFLDLLGGPEYSGLIGTLPAFSADISLRPPPLASELMALRIAALFVLSLSLVPTTLAQTVRFDTNVGNIDLVLNPTNNGNLDQHVDNILRYVESGRYERVVINRAHDNDDDITANDFVMQFGGFFLSDPIFSSFDAFGTVEAFDALIVDEDGDGQVDFSTEGLGKQP